MPTKKEAEEYKKRLEQNMQLILNSKLPQHIKDEMIGKALEKWKMIHDALQGLGLPLEDKD